jgi:hypothetical protein
MNTLRLWTRRLDTRTLWLALALAGAPGTALLANTQEPTLDAALKDHQAVGQARLRVWGFEVYDASLWTAPGFDAQRYAEHRFGLELNYLRSFKGRDIAERSIDEMRGLASVSPPQAAQWLAAMSALFPDVQRGDRITGVHVPGRGAHFYLNGQWRGEIADAGFARLFFGIWLSPKTSQPRMRDNLLQPLTLARQP